MITYNKCKIGRILILSLEKFCEDKEEGVPQIVRELKEMGEEGREGINRAVKGSVWLLLWSLGT